MNKIEHKLVLLMRGAIKSHPKTKLWAEVNCRDNFSLVAYYIAHGAVIDFVSKNLANLSILSWFNDQCQLDMVTKKSKLDAFILATCREMYDVLKAE